MDKFLIINGKRVIINIQYSKIGYSYARIFIQVNDEEYVNFDLSLGATFKMKKEDFMDWMDGADVIPNTTYKKALEEVGINYDLFVKGIDELK